MSNNNLSRRSFIKITGAASAGALALGPLGVGGAEPGSGFTLQTGPPIIPAPKDPRLWPEFRRQLGEWRATTRRKLNYSDALYRRPDFAWVTGNFSCCFVMMCDEAFYDPRAGRYTVGAFLEAGRREFGGYDSVVLWHAYPRIGLDARNQFDFYRDMPGGLPGLRRVVNDLHRAGVRVFIDYNPWDTGTRREAKSDLDALCDLVRAMDVDGIFLDTMDRGAAEFRAKLDAVRVGVVLEGEGALPLDRVCDHHASWAQGFDDSEVPGVLRNKWLERRHLQHQIRRWNYDHTSEMHAAWMNGSGMMVWENVFGSWVGWNARDRALLRSMLPIQRRYAALFCGEAWTPLVPTPKPEDVYGSLWEGGGLRLWTFINRTKAWLGRPLLEIDLRPGEKLFDLVGGVEVKRARGSSGGRASYSSVNGKGGAIVIDSGRIGPRGIACFLAGPSSALGTGFGGFLRRQRRVAAGITLDTTAPKPQTRLVPVKASQAQNNAPEGMVEIGPANVELKIEMRIRECGFYDSSPPAGDCYTFTVRQFRRKLTLGRLAVDLTPVTNAQFAAFLSASKYRPKHPENFLRHWLNGQPPAGKQDHPVVYVDLEDARAYARWAGKRLATEEEWQFAAQGPDGRAYPWGNEMLPGRCNRGETRDTTPVKQFPEGRSPFGIYDLCGNVWEWTESERSDGRTRFCVLRGGSCFAAKGSGWYMDGGPRPANFAAKFLLLWPGLDRCATIGFRCVADMV